MRRFNCPDCRKFLGRTDGNRLETNCRRCQKIVIAIPLELQLSVECERCGRRHYYEMPEHQPTYCVACGLASLIPIPSLKRPLEVPSPSVLG